MPTPTNDLILQTSQCKGLLKKTWFAFFSRFGKLTDIQLNAIPPILAKENVVICSPTASGKTEAVLAPVIERVLVERGDCLSVLYIVPTRALVNDIYERIKGTAEHLGLSVALKHGDKPQLPTKVPNILVTTPESLDSLICRKANLLQQIHTLILDEIHLLDNTYRGDQVRVLIQRLRKITKQEFSVHLLSATLNNPEEIAKRYIESFQVVSGSGSREITCSNIKSLEEIKDICSRDGHKKILVFCNTRRMVEQVSSLLTEIWKPYPVVSHHGKLSKEIREQSETVMKENAVALCVATSTLEIGIDIGNIDLIVFAEIPYSISSLVQRLGRGNRKKNHICAAVITNSSEERFMFNEMLEAVSKGSFNEVAYETDLSVVVQQTFSALFSFPGGLSNKDLLDLLTSLCNLEISRQILEHLERSGHIYKENEKWYAATPIMDMGEKGMIHSNIPDSFEYTVIDIHTHDVIGKIIGMPDHVFVLGGRAWEISHLGTLKLFVKPYRKLSSPAFFSTIKDAGAFNKYLPKKYQK